MERQVAKLSIRAIGVELNPFARPGKRAASGPPPVPAPGPASWPPTRSAASDADESASRLDPRIEPAEVLADLA